MMQELTAVQPAGAGGAAGAAAGAASHPADLN
jgi:hypothetical protein